MRTITSVRNVGISIKAVLGTALMTSVLSLPAKADLFDLNVVVNDQATAKASYKKAEDVIRAVENDELARLLPEYFNRNSNGNCEFSQTQSYCPTILAGIGFRGLPMFLSFENRNSNTLTFRVPSINLQQSFNGPTRDASVDLLVDFLESDGGDLLNRLQAELARTSPSDPVAGNPSSLQGSLIAQDFAAAGFGAGSSSVSRATATSQDRENRLEIGIRAGTFTTGEFSGTSYTVPLSWTMRNLDDPRYQLQIRLPITYTETEGSETYAANLGVGFQFPMGDNWYLTPQLSYGATGSVDQGSIGQLVSGTLTSRYEIQLETTKLTIANMLGYMQTLPFSAGDLKYDPGIKNTITKNGVMVEMPTSWQLFGRGTSIQGAGAVTHLMGDDLFLNTYYDLSLTFGTQNTGTSSLTDFIRMGVNYTFGDDYNAVTASIGYQF